jgi:hypothetical protein
MRDPETGETGDPPTDQEEENLESDTHPTVLIVEDNEDLEFGHYYASSGSPEVGLDGLKT